VRLPLWKVIAAHCSIPFLGSLSALLPVAIVIICARNVADQQRHFCFVPSQNRRSPSYFSLVHLDEFSVEFPSQTYYGNRTLCPWAISLPLFMSGFVPMPCGFSLLLSYSASPPISRSHWLLQVVNIPYFWLTHDDAIPYYSGVSVVRYRLLSRVLS